MKLRIIDYSWGIDRASGTRSEKEVADVCFNVERPCTLPPVGPTRKVFEVKEVGENSLTVFLSEKSGAIVLEAGKPYEYRPVSFDGGHFYRLELE